MLHPIAELCYVNGEEMEDSINLKHGDLIQLGEENLFRFNHPTEALRLKKLKKSGKKVAHVAKVSWLHGHHLARASAQSNGPLCAAELL